MPWTLITGSAKGLGRAIALQLASDGYDVIIHYRKSLHEAQETATLCQKKGVKAELLQCDLGKMHAETILQSFPEIYGLVNNIGLYITKPLSETSQTEWLDLFRINVHAPFFLTQALLPNIKAQQGRIVNIGTSGLHANRVNAYCPAYEISKATLWNLTRTLAKETAADKITVNMVSPGIMINSIDAQEKQHLIPAQRLCTPEEIAHTVAFLFKKECSYITGQNIEITGGFGL